MVETMGSKSKASEGFNLKSRVQLETRDFSKSDFSKAIFPKSFFSKKANFQESEFSSKSEFYSCMPIARLGIEYDHW